jgi:protein SCO1/2
LIQHTARLAREKVSVLASYRLGLAIVATVILGSAAFTVAVVGSVPKSYPAGEDLGEGYDLGPFRFTERSGRSVNEADLADDVWIASFVFTRCPLSCPKLSKVVSDLQHGPLRGSSVRFVSISVDPDFDTPEVLSSYAKTLDADPQQWWFLHGPKAATYELILKKFRLSVAENPVADPKQGTEAVAHSDRLALVDRGNRVIGVFESSDRDAVGRLVARAKQRSGLARDWVRRLPAVNATLNGSCALLLALGWLSIRSRHWKAHAVCMSLGVVVSAVFLGCYLVYHYFVGSVGFRGVGGLRIAYFTTLISHTLLATFGVVPLVSITLIQALRRKFDRHARIARVTFPIWMYVSITGVVIYLMLYQLEIPTSTVLG